MAKLTRAEIERRFAARRTDGSWGPECVDLQRANLSGLDLSYMDMRVTRLDHANLRGIILTRTDLSHSNLADSDIREAYLDFSVLFNVALTRSRLAGTSLVQANLIMAHLAAADLRNANFTGADFRQTQLINALLQGAVFCKATFDGSAVIYIDFSNTDIRGADFSSAEPKNLITADFSAAIYDRTTKWPTGFDPVEVEEAKRKIRAAYAEADWQRRYQDLGMMWHWQDMHR